MPSREAWGRRRGFRWLAAGVVAAALAGLAAVPLLSGGDSRPTYAIGVHIESGEGQVGVDVVQSAIERAVSGEDPPFDLSVVVLDGDRARLQFEEKWTSGWIVDNPDLVAVVSDAESSGSLRAGSEQLFQVLPCLSGLAPPPGGGNVLPRAAAGDVGLAVREYLTGATGPDVSSAFLLGEGDLPDQVGRGLESAGVEVEHQRSAPFDADDEERWTDLEQRMSRADAVILGAEETRSSLDLDDYDGVKMTLEPVASTCLKEPPPAEAAERALDGWDAPRLHHAPLREAEYGSTDGPAELGAHAGTPYALEAYDGVATVISALQELPEGAGAEEVRAELASAVKGLRLHGLRGPLEFDLNGVLTTPTVWIDRSGDRSWQWSANRS